MRNPFPATTRFLSAVTSACVWMAVASHAQTLARPGWAGSGLHAEPWWRNAVFYRIVPVNFQDSDGDGEGDLRGLAQRLGYLQTLGVDAVVLETPFEDAGFDELLEEAGRHHIRLLVTASGSEGAALLPRARQWLTRGAAGLWFRPAPAAQAAGLSTQVHALRVLADSFPGERLLVEDTSREQAQTPAPGAGLTVRALQIGTLGQGDDASLLRTQLNSAGAVPGGSAPLLLLHDETAAKETNAERIQELRRVEAMALFASRSAVALDYGQELGRSAFLPSAFDTSPAHTGEHRLMQWTPSNVTLPAVVAPAATPAPPRREDVFGAFVPYTPPSAEKPADKRAPDLDALPGFTSGTLPEGSVGRSDAAANAAIEDNDPASLLNFYRRLAQLHHGKAALREGMAAPLDLANESVLALVRRSPTGDRTAAPVLIAFNLTGQRLTVSLAVGFAKLKVRGGYLRVLLASPARETNVPQSTDSLVLAPWGAVMAELEYE